MKVNVSEVLKNSTILNRLFNIHYIKQESAVVKYHYLEQTYAKRDNEKIARIDIKLEESAAFLNRTNISTVIKDSIFKEMVDNYNIDPETKIQKVFEKETALKIYKQFKNSLFKLAKKTYLSDLTRWDKFKSWLWNILGGDYKKTSKIKCATDLIKQITKSSNSIAKKCRFGPANFVICNSVTGSILSESAYFQYNTSNDLSLDSPFLLKVGIINNIEVIIDYNLSNKEPLVYVGRKPNENEPGIHFIFKVEEDNEITIKKEDESTRYILSFRSSMEKFGKTPENNYTMFYYKLIE